jgi:carbon-monoxide dehydrogenase small subunit
VALRVNGDEARFDLRPNTLLANALRDELRLTSVKIACETSQCGACTVLVDGLATKSCTVLAAACDGAAVTTVEGLAHHGPLHPLQRAFIDHHALQCGFCTPGMIMLALDLLSHDSSPSDAAIRRALTGNVCRCTGYEPIVRAISAAGSAAIQPSE